MPCAELAALGLMLFGDLRTGGPTRAGTSKLVLKYQAAGSGGSHLSFAGTDESDVRELLQSYRSAGIKGW